MAEDAADTQHLHKPAASRNRSAKGTYISTVFIYIIMRKKDVVSYLGLCVWCDILLLVTFTQLGQK